MSRRSPFADEAPGSGLLATFYTRRWLTAFGLGAILVVLGLLGTSIAVFNHTFAHPAHVQLEVDRAGSQLSTGADVKLNGIIVGRVDSIRLSPASDGAILDLAIDRNQLALIPANVTAQVIPKTIFGEKYVDLGLPTEPAAARLADGDVIQRDRSSVAVETRTVLNHLGPLLDAVSPAELNTTLTAIATALQGRGKLVGETIEAVHHVAKSARPTIPLVLQDARLLASVSDSYRRAAGPLLRTLGHSTTTARTLTAHRRQFERLLASTSRFADVVRGFVDRVGADHVKLVAVSRPALEMIARYSSEIACTVRGVTAIGRRLALLFADGPYLKARMYLTVSRGAYKPGIDAPRLLDLSAYGPYCPVIPRNGTGTVPWPPIPRELDQLRGVGNGSLVNSVDGLPGSSSTTNPLATLLLGGPLG